LAVQGIGQSQPFLPISMKTKKKNIDPLFQLFEKHLLSRSYDDAAAFTKQLAKDYLAYLDSTPAQVPVHLRASVLEDLEQECHELLVKKMYGVIVPSDYQNRGKVVAYQRKEDSLELIELAQTSPSDDQAKE
jgi:hypothetical protein